MNKNTGIIIAVVLIIVAGIGGFLGGMQYQKTRAGVTALGGANGTFRRFNGAGGVQNGQNLAPVRGEVLSVSNGTMTVKLANGGTTIIVLPSSANYMQTTKASQSDIKTGDTVTVIGTKNSDGSVTAQDVQLGNGAFQRPLRSPSGSQPSASGTGY